MLSMHEPPDRGRLLSGTDHAEGVNGCTMTDRKSAENSFTRDEVDAVNKILQCRNYYRILSVDRDCGEDTLKEAYKSLALKFHPDKNKIPGAHQAFQAISNAYHVLSDPAKRREYDQMSQYGFTFQFTSSHGMHGFSENPLGGVSAEDLFKKVFMGTCQPGEVNMTDLIQQNYIRLHSKLDGEILCPFLEQKQILTHNQHLTYLDKQRPHKNEYLLDILTTRSKRDVLTFLEALLETGQEHLLLNEEGERTKDELIRIHRVEWEQLDCDVIASRLRQHGVLSHLVFENITHQGAPRQRMRRLLDVLHRGPVHTFQKFQEVVHEIPSIQTPTKELSFPSFEADCPGQDSSVPRPVQEKLCLEQHGSTKTIYESEEKKLVPQADTRGQQLTTPAPTLLYILVGIMLGMMVLTLLVAVNNNSAQPSSPGEGPGNLPNYTAPSGAPSLLYWCLVAGFFVVVIVIGYMQFHQLYHRSVSKEDIYVNLIKQKIISELKFVYTRQYKTIPLLPWKEYEDLGQLEELFTRLNLVKEHMTGGLGQKVPLGNHVEIFDTLDDGTHPYRIIIRGEAGIGKTTLVNRIATEWADQKKEPGSPSEFPFETVFVLRLRAVQKSDSFEKMVRDQLFAEDSEVTAEDLKTYLKQGGQGVLFLLDGYDEYRNQTVEIGKLIEGKVLRYCTVVVTTRPSRMPRAHRDKLLEVTGFRTNEQYVYIHKFYSKNRSKAESLKREVHEKQMTHLTGTPILLHFLCVLYSSMESLPTSVATLYMRLLEFMYKRQGLKANLPTIDEILFGLREVALLSLIEGSLEFEIPAQGHDEFIDFALHIGLLQLVVTRASFTFARYASFVHKTIHEFVVGWNIIHSGDRNYLENCNSMDKVIELENAMRFACDLASRNLHVIPKAETVLEQVSRISRESLGNKKLSFTKIDFDSQFFQAWKLQLLCYGELHKRKMPCLEALTLKDVLYFTDDITSDSKLTGALDRLVHEDSNPDSENPGCHKPSWSLIAEMSLAEGQDPSTLYVWRNDVTITFDSSLLQVLYLHHVTMDASALVPLLGSQIRTLCFRYITVTDESPIDANVTNCPKWTSVVLYRCKFDESGARYIVSGITHSPGLEYLDIREPSLPGMRDIPMNAPPPTELRVLNFVEWSESSSDSVALLQWAWKSPKLDSCRVAECSEAAVALADIPWSPSLRQFAIKDMEVGILVSLASRLHESHVQLVEFYGLLESDKLDELASCLEKNPLPTSLKCLRILNPMEGMQQSKYLKAVSGAVLHAINHGNLSQLEIQWDPSRMTGSATKALHQLLRETSANSRFKVLLTSGGLIPSLTKFHETLPIDLQEMPNIQVVKRLGRIVVSWEDAPLIHQFH